MTDNTINEQTCDHDTWDEDCESCDASIDLVIARNDFAAWVYACVMRHDSAADQVQDIAALLAAEGFIVP